MKKNLTELLCMMLAAVMVSGCTGNTAEHAESEKEEEAVQEESVQEETAIETEEPSESKPLLIYFSRTGEQYSVGEIDKGNTAIVAEMIEEYTDADVFEILPQEDYYPYTYDELTEVAKEEQNSQARPAYQKDLPDLSDYDVIFIGSPVWWGDWPMIMYTLFETNDFSGKTLIPFNTNEGSGSAGFEDKLKAACPDSTVRSGLYTYGHDAQNRQEETKENVREWLSELGLISE